MKEFEKSEQQGRQYFSMLYPNYIKDFSTGRYDWWDVSGYTSSTTELLNEGKPYIAELKKREKIKHDEYTTVMLEVEKYNNLMNHTSQTGIPSFYICFYADRTLVANLSHLDLTQIKMDKWYLPTYTKEDAGQRWKYIYEVPLSYFQIKSKGFAELDREVINAN